MSGRMWSSVLALSAVAVLGCGGAGERDAEDDGAPGPAPWLAGLPERAAAAAPGEVVWAVVPQSGSAAAEVATYQLVSAEGALAVLEDDLGNRYRDVPGALVHPLSSFPEAELAVGSAVLADRWDARGVVGRVAGLDGGDVRLAFDWNGVTVTGPMPVVVPLPAGERSPVPRWVAFRPAAGEAWQRGLCFAESAERAWIRDDAGFARVVEKDAVEPLSDLGRLDLSRGDAVAAYSWGQGFRSGVVAEVLEPGLRYSVTLDDASTRAFFFDRLTVAFGDRAL